MTSPSVSRRAWSLLLVPLLAACASGGAAPPAGSPALSPEAVAEEHPEIHWVRTAAEHDADFRQTYAWAGRGVEVLATGRAPGSWAVILDADETVLDNSEYQRRRAARGLGYTPESWTEWVMEEAAPALPGAVLFMERVRSLGGRVAIVTNRAAHECDATRRNLEAVGVAAAVVLCRQPGEDGKDGRFHRIQEGTAAPGLAPLEVVAWVGDNIEDFPGGSQARAGEDGAFLAEFGVRYFVLPNPMYGSWQDNPPR